MNRISKPKVTVAVDGSLYRFHPHFHKLMMRMTSALIKPGIDVSITCNYLYIVIVWLQLLSVTSLHCIADHHWLHADSEVATSFCVIEYDGIAVVVNVFLCTYSLIVWYSACISAFEQKYNNGLRIKCLTVICLRCSSLLPQSSVHLENKQFCIKLISVLYLVTHNKPFKVQYGTF